MRRNEYKTFLDWFIENEAEYNAVIEAQDGNAFPLAEYLERGKPINTIEAREWIAARLRGDKLQRGAKRTVKQQAMEFGIWGEVLDIQKNLEVSEYKAKIIYLDRHPKINSETLNSYVFRAKRGRNKIKRSAAMKTKSST